MICPASCAIDSWGECKSVAVHSHQHIAEVRRDVCSLLRRHATTPGRKAHVRCAQEAVELYDARIAGSLLNRSGRRLVLRLRCDGEVHKGDPDAYATCRAEDDEGACVISLRRGIWHDTRPCEVGGVPTGGDPVLFAALVIEHELGHLYHDLLRCRQGMRGDHDENWFRIMGAWFGHCTSYIR